MAAAFLPSIIVPLVGLIFPRVAIRAFFVYAEKESIGLDVKLIFLLELLF